jgi:hypothetical protein
MTKLLTLSTAFLLCLFVQGQTEKAFPNPSIWLNFNNYNDSLMQFYDISGNLNHASNSVSFDYLTCTMNFHPCMKIDSISNPFFINYLAKPSSEITVFSVYKAKKGYDEHGVWSLTLDSAKKIDISTQNITDFLKKNEYSDTTSDVPVVNFLRYSWKQTSIDSTISSISIMGNDTLQFNGKFAEFMFFDTLLSINDIAKTHTYLGIKYGISIEGLDYINSKNEILLSYSENKMFSNELAGLGKDSLIHINQKQGCAMGGESILTIFSGDFKTYNDSNNTHLNEYDFLIWGDNGKDIFDITPDTSGIDYVQFVSERKWKMTRLGSTAMDIQTNIKINFSGIDNDIIPVLIINYDGDFLFPLNNSYSFYPDSLDSLGNYFYSNIYWDIDSSGYDAFSFQFVEIFDYDNRNQMYNSDSNEQNSNNDCFIQKINIYPNPSDGLVNIDIHIFEKADILIRIYDESMKLVKKNNYKGSDLYKTSFFLETKGIYLILIESNNNVFTFKTVIQ